MSKVYVFLNDAPVESGLNNREAWMPKDGQPYFDQGAKRWFASRQQKRAWLAQHGMREAGELVNPEKQIAGREKTHRDPVLRQRIQEHIRSQGGTQGLLQRIREGRGTYV